MTDKVASSLVASARWGFDFVTRYKVRLQLPSFPFDERELMGGSQHASPEEALAALNKDGKEGLPLEELIKQGYVMSEEQWMARILFLESIAGVPGMVAGMLRHLKSLRLMKRDGGWIHSEFLAGVWWRGCGADAVPVRSFARGGSSSFRLA